MKEFEKQDTLGKSCPSLNDFKCIIHKDLERPLVCKQFPIFFYKQSFRN